MAPRLQRLVRRSGQLGRHVPHQIGTKMLAGIPAIAEIHLEANNRTWDIVAERGDELGIFTDARPPYGCLGLKLKR